MYQKQSTTSFVSFIASYYSSSTHRQKTPADCLAQRVLLRNGQTGVFLHYRFIMFVVFLPKTFFLLLWQYTTTPVSLISSLANRNTIISRNGPHSHFIPFRFLWCSMLNSFLSDETEAVRLYGSRWPFPVPSTPSAQKENIYYLLLQSSRLVQFQGSCSRHLLEAVVLNGWIETASLVFTITHLLYWTQTDLRYCCYNNRAVKLDTSA